MEKIDSKRLKKVIASKRLGNYIWKIFSTVPKSNDEKAEEEHIKLRAKAIYILAEQLTYDQNYSESELSKFIKKYFHVLNGTLGLILMRECQRRGLVDYFDINE